MSNVGIENYFGGWGGGLLLEVLSPKRLLLLTAMEGDKGGGGRGGDGKEKAGQASPEAIRYTRIYIKTKFKSQNVTNIPSPDCMTTRIQNFSNADSQRSLCRFNL